LFLAASGPVRLFTPYKRRRRNQIDSDNDSVKKKRQNIPIDPLTDSETDQIIAKEEETWQTLADGIDGSTDYLEHSSHCMLIKLFCKLI